MIDIAINAKSFPLRGNMSDLCYDVVVIGSGASGSFAAKELTSQGLSVALIEAGREITPDDFDPTRKPKTPSQINILDRVVARTRGQKIQSRAVFFRGLQSGFYVNDRDSPYTTPKDAPFVWIRGHQAGGRTHTFGRVLLRWTDDDFKSRSRTGRGVDWPISYADLAPYYDEVERFLGLYGNDDGVARQPDGIYCAPAKLSPAEVHFKKAVEGSRPGQKVISWRYIAPEPSRVSRPLRDAKESGRLTAYYNSIARRVLSSGKKTTGVEIIDRHSQTITTINAEHVVLCVSPIESVRLLLNSATAEHPDGLGNSSGLLGHFFMDQIPLIATGVYGPVRGFTHVTTQPDDPFYDHSGGIFISRLGSAMNAGKHGDYTFQGSIGRAPTAESAPAKLSFFGFGQMLPYEDNRITLDPRKRDKWGIPVPNVRCAMKDNERAVLAEMEASLLDIVNAVGGEIEFIGSPGGIRQWGRGAYPDADPVSRFLFLKFFRQVMVMGAAIHESGGARMGTTSENSVLNQWGQSWDIPNLYVTDASAFASSGVVGTTLTIMAQTIRACRHLVAERVR